MIPEHSRIAPVRIEVNCGSATAGFVIHLECISPYFSASLPFVASSVTLRTDGEPFIAAYDVAADIVKPTIIEHLGNATTSTTTNSTVK